MLLGIAGSVFLYNVVDPAQAGVRREARTEAAMTEVRDALIGWSVARTSPTDGVNARPGELPCPDINPLDGFEDGNCAAGAIGRVPWRTLGIPEPKDEFGETLWYTIAGPFRIWNTNPNPINSDTKGNLTVYQHSTAAVRTTEAVAIIFASGAPLGAQNRDATVVLCSTTGTSIARNLCAANYLETAATVNNATIGGPFINAQSFGTFNDKLLVITTADLMPPVEMRVGREVRTALQSYKNLSACACYPWADTSDGVSDAPPVEPPTKALNRGRFPTTALPENWGTGAIPNLPGWVDATNHGWFERNNWPWVIYYSSGKNFLEGGGVSPACTSCVDSTLTVDGMAGREVVILTPGPAGPSRPPAVPGTDPTFWQYYFEDAQNQDHQIDMTGNDLYVSPSSTAYPRDRVYTIP
jgi:hypothetical protein